MAIWDLFKKKDTSSVNLEVLDEENVDIQSVSSYMMKNESIFFEEPYPEDLDACTYQDKYLFHQDIMP